MGISFFVFNTIFKYLANSITYVFVYMYVFMYIQMHVYVCVFISVCVINKNLKPLPYR